LSASVTITGSGAIAETFREAGALLTGHFRLSSGRHAEVYVQCQAIMGQPVLAGPVAEAIADRVRGLGADAVLGPALGAIVLGYEVARALTLPSLFCERSAGEFALRRGQAITPGQKIVVVENVVTTGGSALEAITLIERLGGEVVGVAAMVDRSPRGAKPFGDLPFEALLRVEAETFAEADCPACAAGRALESPGSRHLTPSRPL
jgi:orotate phosphoribosyltransferase